MKSAVKRKNFYLDEEKIKRAKKILGARNETETIVKALDLVVFRKDLIDSLKAVAGKGDVEKIF